MEIVSTHLAEPPGMQENVISLLTDRFTLAKRRWRGVAGDGREFGFDLDHALSHGDAIMRNDYGCYAVFQTPEPVLEVTLPATPAEAAALAWQIGNLHFPIEAVDGVIRTSDDPAVRQMLDRAHIPYEIRHTVFQPLAAAVHGHHHHH